MNDRMNDFRELLIGVRTRLLEAASAPGLMIVHKISPENLAFCFEHLDGSLAAPSLMIVDPSIPIDSNKFGSIALVVDPKRFEYNRCTIYDRDIYSSRFPPVTWSMDRQGINGVLDEIRAKYPETQHMQRHGIDWNKMGKDGIEEIYWCQEVRYLYLREVEGVSMKVARVKAGADQTEMHEVAKKHGLDGITHGHELWDVPEDQLVAFTAEYNARALAKVSDRNRDLYADIYPTDPEAIRAAGVRDGRAFGTLARSLEAVRAQRRGDPDVNTILSRANRKFNPAMDRRFRTWAAANFKQFIHTPKFTVGYNSSGNPTRKEVDVRAVSDHMSGRQRNKEGQIYGVPSLAAAMAKSITYLKDAAKLAPSRLVSESDMNEWKEQKMTEFEELVEAFDPYCAYSNGGMTALVECLIGRDRFSSAYPGAPGHLRSEATDFMNSLKKAPTEYFEVKYNKALKVSGRGGFQVAVVPRSELRNNDELRNALEASGLRVVAYSGSLSDRLRTMRGYQLK